MCLPAFIVSGQWPWTRKLPDKRRQLVTCTRFLSRRQLQHYMCVFSLINNGWLWFLLGVCDISDIIWIGFSCTQHSAVQQTTTREVIPSNRVTPGASDLLNINIIDWDDNWLAYLDEIRSCIKSIYIKFNCFEIVVPVATQYVLVAQTSLEIYPEFTAPVNSGKQTALVEYTWYTYSEECRLHLYAVLIILQFANFATMVHNLILNTYL